MKTSKHIIFFFIVGIIIGQGDLWAAQEKKEEIRIPPVELRLDCEEKTKDGSPLVPRTQSLNRYFSVLREYQAIEGRYASQEGDLLLNLSSTSRADRIDFKNIDARFLVPLLPYPHKKILDAFDKAMIMLAEYSRNGISMSYHEDNDQVGFFSAPETLLKNDAEYFFKEGQLAPNPNIRPTRMQLINNCLAPGLWELSATDSVGEMYHAWFKMPVAAYFALLRSVNDFEMSDQALEKALAYQKVYPSIALDLDRLRKKGRTLHTTKAQLAGNKTIGGYSNQDSRRKVQRGFFWLERKEAPLQVETFASLMPGDLFKLLSFVPPGIYTKKEARVIPFEPDWTGVKIFEVEPLTAYPGAQHPEAAFGSIEIIIQSSDKRQAFVIGNIPIDLLVFQDDYRIPGFGVGVLSTSELVERRYFRFKEGPKPHYAFLAHCEGNDYRFINNHETGYEQVYLRPFINEKDEIFLRITINSYERIVDLLEVEVPIQGNLADRIRAASAQYKPPLFKVYSDSNIL